MRPVPRIHFLRLCALVVLLAAIVAVTAFYERTRPHLAPESASERLQRVRDLAKSLESYGYNPSSRATLAAVREFFLDYPAVQEPQLRLGLALAMTSQPDADWLFIGD